MCLKTARAKSWGTPLVFPSHPTNPFAQNIGPTHNVDIVSLIKECDRILVVFCAFACKCGHIDNIFHNFFSFSFLDISITHREGNINSFFEKVLGNFLTGWRNARALAKILTNKIEKKGGNFLLFFLKHFNQFEQFFSLPHKFLKKFIIFNFKCHVSEFYIHSVKFLLHFFLFPFLFFNIIILLIG